MHGYSSHSYPSRSDSPHRTTADTDPHTSRGIPWPVCAVLLLAALLRWWQPALVGYSYDEAHIVGMAQGIAQLNGTLPLLSGGTSLGLQRSAFDTYVLALPLLLTGGRIEAAVLGLGALGVLAVALTFVLGRRIGRTFDVPAVGTLAALFMAANPWLVLFDRRLWAHIQVVFSVLLLLLAWDAVVAGRGMLRNRPERGGWNWAAFWFPVVAVLQLLSHVLALLQGWSWLAAWLVAPGRWWQRSTGLGVAVGLCLLLPYGWALRNHARNASVTVDPGTLDWPSPLWEHLADPHDWLPARQLVTGSGFSSTIGLPDTANPWWQTGASAVAPAMLVLIAVGVLYLLSAALRHRGGNSPERGRAARLLLLWGLGPLLLLGIAPMQVYLQYWTVLLPLPALGAALGLCALASAADRLLPTRLTWTLLWALAGAIAVIWVGGYGAYIAKVDEGSTVSLRTWQQMTSAARELADEANTQEVRVAVRGVDPGYDGEPAAVATLIGNPPFARFVAPTTPPALLLSFDRPSLYLWTIDAPDTQAQLADVGRVAWEMALTPDRPPARIYQLPPANELALDFTRLDPPPVFDVGMMLLGYDFPEVSGSDGDAGNRSVEVRLFWRVLDPPMAVREQDFTAFNHILGSEGEMAAQIDGLALLSRDWWPGDVLIQPYVVELPPGEYTWRVGLYSRSDGSRAHTQDGSDAVDLPGLTVR